MATGAVERACLTFGDYTIDPVDERLIGHRGPVKLGHKAYRVLLLLAEQEGRLLTKDELFSSVWDGTTVGESALTSVVKELRRALGDESRTPRYIESVYGRGYRLLPKVKRHPAGYSPSQVTVPARRSAGVLARPPLLSIPPFEDAALCESAPNLGSVLRDEILLALSRFRDIRLVTGVGAAHSTVAADYGERDYQLTVRLVEDADSVRAFARLVNLATQAIIWADNIDLADGRLGPSVDSLVRRIAVAALSRLHDDLLSHPPAQPQDAYDLYLLTKLQMRAMDSFSEAQAVADAWEHLIEHHPDFAPAYPPLSRLYNTDYCYTGLGATGQRERDRAYGLAHRAFAIDPTESHFHTLKGWCHLWAGEVQMARVHFDEALQLNPYNQERLVEVATAFMFMEELDRAAELLERCRTLAPFATHVPHHELGLLFLLRHDFEAATEQLARVTRRTASSDLYELLALAGSEAPALRDKARTWLAGVRRIWRGPEPLDDDGLFDWVLYQHPFQAESRRKWILDLFTPVLSSGV